MRVEIRSVTVSLLGHPDKVLPVDRFHRVPTKKEVNPKQHDLLEVLESLFEARKDIPYIYEPNEGENSEDLEELAELRRQRLAIVVTSTKRVGRRLRVDFQWSTDAPERLFDLDSKQESYTPTDSERGLVTSTVLFEVPTGVVAHNAYMAVEHRGGIVSVFEPALQRWFADNTDVSDFRLRSNGHVPAGFWQQFVENGEVVDLELTRLSIPSDIADLGHVTDESVEREGLGSARLLIESNVGNMTALKEFVRQRLTSTSSGGVDLNINGVDYASARAKMRHRGMERTMSLSVEPSSRLAPAFEVDVPKELRGQPRLARMHEEMTSVLDDIGAT